MPLRRKSVRGKALKQSGVNREREVDSNTEMAGQLPPMDDGGCDAGQADTDDTTQHDDDLHPPAKRKKVADSLSEEQEDALAEWFRENPIFYDQSLKDFKNKRKREQLLDAKAKELDMTGSDVFLWFKSQRTMYGRLRKKKSGQAVQTLTARQRWVMETFSYLGSHVLVRTDRTQIGKGIVVSEEIMSEVAKIEEEEDFEASHEASFPQPVLLSVAQSVSPYTAISGNEGIPGASGTLTTPKGEFVQGSNDSRTAWTHWMGNELMDLNDDLWRNFQRESFEMVMRYTEQNRSLRLRQQQLTRAAPAL